MLQNSMRWLIPKVKELRANSVDVRWCLQIHDEVMFIVEENYAEDVKKLVLEGLENHHEVDNLLVPVKAEGSIARVWGELE